MFSNLYRFGVRARAGVGTGASDRVLPRPGVRQLGPGRPLLAVRPRHALHLRPAPARAIHGPHGVDEEGRQTQHWHELEAAQQNPDAAQSPLAAAGALRLAVRPGAHLDFQTVPLTLFPGPNRPDPAAHESEQPLDPVQSRLQLHASLPRTVAEAAPQLLHCLGSAAERGAQCPPGNIADAAPLSILPEPRYDPEHSTAVAGRLPERTLLPGGEAPSNPQILRKRQLLSRRVGEQRACFSVGE